MNLLMPYDFANIEAKWQSKWNEAKCFESHTDTSREKFFGIINAAFARPEKISE